MRVCSRPPRPRPMPPAGPSPCAGRAEALCRRLLPAVVLCVWTPGIAAEATNLTVRVEADRLADPSSPPFERQTLPAGLATIPGVSLRSQGLGAPQADLSIRGAPFSSSGLLVAGLPLRNPQTEHFQADLPAPLECFAPPTLLTGLDQFLRSSGHPAGSVSLGFAPVRAGGSAEVGGGPGVQFADLRASRKQVLDDRTTLGTTAFAEGASIDRTDGFQDNDLNRLSGGAALQMCREAGQLDLFGATGWRKFGARGFYGAPPAFPSEEEVSETLVLGSMTLGAADDESRRRLSLAWERTDDQYWLSRATPALYANHHVSDVYAAHADTIEPVFRSLSVGLRADADWETLESRYAGTLPGAGLGNHARGEASLAILPRYSREDWTATVGVSCHAFTRDEPAFLPAAGLTWRPAPGRQFSLSCTETVRPPSYTELNYLSPGSLGNLGLKRQHSRLEEFSWREEGDSASGGISLFAEQVRQQVDWVRLAPGGRWTAVNLDSVRTLGLVADLALVLNGATEGTLSYTALAKQSDTPVYASRYALDYPRHAFRAGVRSRLLPGLSLFCWQEWAIYADNPARTGSDLSCSAHGELRWRPLRDAETSLAIGISNPWNRDFQPYPGQPGAGRRITASLRQEW